jgi:peptidoglycan hydrolase-like protein with peptidoglycan-binding domain
MNGLPQAHLKWRNKMFPKSKTVWTWVVLTFLATAMLGLSLTSLAFAVNPNGEKPAGLNRGDIKKVQETLRDKGYYTGEVDGIIGPQTRAGIRQYQQSESLPVTGRLDAETAGKLGVGPESTGGSFKGAGQEVGKGGKEVGHEMKKGEPVAAGKELGKGVGRGGKKFGEGVKKAVSPESDRGDREKKEQPEPEKQPQ